MKSLLALIYIWPLIASISFGVWMHSFYAGMFVFALLNVAAVLRKG